jgi:hypothetical protein
MNYEPQDAQYLFVKLFIITAQGAQGKDFHWLMTFSSPEPALMSASLKKRDSPQT